MQAARSPPLTSPRGVGQRGQRKARTQADTPAKPHPGQPLVRSTVFLPRAEIPSLAGSAGRVRRLPGLCQPEQDSEMRWSGQACLCTPPAPRLLTPPPPRGSSSKQGLAQGCGQRGVNRDGSRSGWWGPARGSQHRCCKCMAGWWESSPYLHARTCPPLPPPWMLQGPPAHQQARRAPPPHRSRYRHHSTRSGLRV